MGRVTLLLSSSMSASSSVKTHLKRNLKYIIFGVVLFVLLAVIIAVAAIVYVRFENQAKTLSALEARTLSVERGLGSSSATTAGEDRLTVLEKRMKQLSESVPSSIFPGESEFSMEGISALRDVVQERLFATYTKRVGSFIQVIPFQSRYFVKQFSIATSIWNKYPEHEFYWVDGSERNDYQSTWELRLMPMVTANVTLAPGISITEDRQLHADGEQYYSEHCAGPKYSDRLRQVAAYLENIFPDEAGSDICDRIIVGAELSGNTAEEYDEAQNKSVPVPVRAYTFFPKKLQAIVNENTTEYTENQPLAVVVIARERGLWQPVAYTFRMMAYTGQRSDGFFSEKVTQDVKKDVERMTQDFAKQTTLASAFCGYGDCY